MSQFRHLAEGEFTALCETKLETTIAKTKTFEVKVGDLPFSAVHKCLAYGFQRWLNDRVGGAENSVETKIQSTSLFLADVLNDTWQTARSAPVSDETNIRRRVTLAALSVADRKSLVHDENRAEILDAAFAANEAILRPIFEAELAKSRAPKVIIGVAVDLTKRQLKIANKQPIA